MHGFLCISNWFGNFLLFLVHKYGKEQSNTVWKWDVEHSEWFGAAMCSNLHILRNLFSVLSTTFSWVTQGIFGMTWPQVVYLCTWILLLCEKSVVMKKFCLPYPLKYVFFTCCWNCLQLSTVESSCSRQKEQIELWRKSSGLKNVLSKHKYFT